MIKKNVAIFPAGTEIGLEIHNALRFAKDVNMIGLSSVKDHSAFVYKNIITDAPFLNDKALKSYLIDFVKQYDIEYIFPAHDDAVVFLTSIEKELGVKVIAPSEETAKICRYKALTYASLSAFDFTPKLYSVDALREEDFPVFIKPDKGQGSHGAQLIKTKEGLSLIKNIDEFVICEYFPGEEYTISCISDYQNKLLYASQRTRSRVKTGISVSSFDYPLDANVALMAEQISKTLNMTGAWFFQVKKDKDDEYKLLEVAARIAGSMGLHRNQGVNFPLLSLYIKDKMDVGVIENPLSLKLDRAFISRYEQNFVYKHVYIDFDDTILFDDKINPFIMHFLFQCRNKKIDIHLITRHAYDIYETLETYCIDKNIFASIIHITDKKKKSLYIIEKEAIFIDDAFSERYDVGVTCQIPVFDLDAIECLLDWRL